MSASGAHLSALAEQDSVVDRLVHDHMVINELLNRMDLEASPCELAAVHSELVREVVAHERVEDQVLLPAMSDRSRVAGQRTTELWVDMIAQEHKEMGQLMSAMCDLDPAGLAFEKRSSALVFLMRGAHGGRGGAHVPAPRILVHPRGAGCYGHGGGAGPRWCDGGGLTGTSRRAVGPVMRRAPSRRPCAWP